MDSIITNETYLMKELFQMLKEDKNMLVVAAVNFIAVVGALLIVYSWSK